MNNAPFHTAASHETNQRVACLFAAQQAAFQAAPNPSLGERLDHLRAIKRQIARYQDVLADAMSSDFGHRVHSESKMLDLLGSMMEVNHSIAHLKRWMKPSRRSTELLFITNSVKVMYQPKGVVGVVTPWNLPIYLSLGPLIAALAAGNRVMIKMSEATPATNAVLKALLAEILPEDRVAVVGEELLDPSVFTTLPFNHIVFTGSPAVGKIVMRAAAANLTPVTLELGGKSPAVVTRHYPVADAAKRITHGKTTNAGQICVSPDYALVPSERVDEFVEGVRRAFKGLSGDGKTGPTETTHIVDERQHQRIRRLLEDARAKGAHIESCGPAGDSRAMPLQIITNVTPDMLVMTEELFGPLLPIVPYDTMDEAIHYINERERPLALYCFSHDRAERQKLLTRTHSGGVSINDWGWQAVNHDAPFGGIGNSGMGNYHGVEGFRELSHAKTVYKRHRFFPVDLFYPPYGNLAQRLSMKFFLGKADESLRASAPER